MFYFGLWSSLLSEEAGGRSRGLHVCIRPRRAVRRAASGQPGVVDTEMYEPDVVDTEMYEPGVVDAEMHKPGVGDIEMYEPGVLDIESEVYSLRSPQTRMPAWPVWIFCT